MKREELKKLFPAFSQLTQFLLILTTLRCFFTLVHLHVSITELDISTHTGWINQRARQRGNLRRFGSEDVHNRLHGAAIGMAKTVVETKDLKLQAIRGGTFVDGDDDTVRYL